ncbi:hypothetical protein LTR02_017076, partial [Friedmanniomyces endolithicus]
MPTTRPPPHMTTPTRLNRSRNPKARIRPQPERIQHPAALIQRLVRPEQQRPPRDGVQQHVQPAVRGDQRARDAELWEGDRGAGHGGQAHDYEGERAEDVDDWVGDDEFGGAAGAEGGVGGRVEGFGDAAAEDE